ncbi:hypothetical protein TNCT_552281 [Trichonephila clavata]|uniref:RING-type domain-containing protein n=1 Tax=Trichonephila clavata TaxID=2740835 RepID=A0A8X6KNN6_TRICU|nr:hypothetical protein TNCT_552281 [Trichonephila clavata]
MTGAHVEVTSSLPAPPLMTRCDKTTPDKFSPPGEVLTVQAFRQHFHDLDALSNVLCPSGQSGKLLFLPFLCSFEPSKSEDYVLHRMAERGHGAYIRSTCTECIKPDLYQKVTVAWCYGGSQDLEQWGVTLGHTALLPFQIPWLEFLKNVPFAWSPCISPHTTECGHSFHKGCLERTQSPTCPFCRQTV